MKNAMIELAQSAVIAALVGAPVALYFILMVK